MSNALVVFVLFLTFHISSLCISSKWLCTESIFLLSWWFILWHQTHKKLIDLSFDICGWTMSINDNTKINKCSSFDIFIFLHQTLLVHRLTYLSSLLWVDPLTSMTTQRFKKGELKGISFHPHHGAWLGSYFSRIQIREAPN